MKKLVTLIILLIIIASVVVSKEPLSPKIDLIKKHNSKLPETRKWEYLKDKVFDEDGVIQKGYTKPVKVTLGSCATDKDSLIVRDFIKELKILLPAVIISFEFENFGEHPLDLVYLSFRKDSIRFNKFLKKQNLPDGNIIGKLIPGFTDISTFSKNTFLNFEFNENIPDETRNIYITGELLKAIFLTPSMSYSFNNEFEVGFFNDVEHDPSYGYLGDLDKFLLQKLYAPDFDKQFKTYMHTYYPWRYAIFFVDQENYYKKALLIVFGIGLLIFILMFGFFFRRRFKYNFLNYYFPILSFWLFYPNLESVYSYLTSFDSTTSIGSIFIFQLIILPLVALVSAGVLWLLEKNTINNHLNTYVKPMFNTAYTFVALCTPVAIMFFKKGGKENLFEFYLPIFYFIIGASLLRGVLIYLDNLSASLVKQKDLELSRLKELHAQAETKLLQSQINPHFLYNSLNSIASLAPIDADKTQKMAHSLSDLFKYSINRKDKKMSTVKDEIEMVKSYLEIEKIRFGDRLQFDIEVDNAIENYEIPLFLIQPLVENAVKHGISQNEGNGKIVLKIEKDEKELIISVSDNGPNFPEGLVSGHGLQTVFDLLRLSYGDKASLNWTNTPEKTITITIPETV